MSRTVRIKLLPHKPTTWSPADLPPAAQRAYRDLTAALAQGVPHAELTDLWYAAGCPPVR